MSVNIRKHLVSNNIAKRVTYPGTNSKKYIVIHETANTRKGANANAHARLQASGNSRQASWHYQVDDKEIVQSFSDNAQCWHAGNRKYNEQSIGIEICVNEDGDFKKAVDNAVKLTRHLMDKYNISANNVIQHNQASGKNCPRYLRSGAKGITWHDFKAKINETTSKPKSTSTTKKTTSTYKGNSLVDYLKSIGVDSSFSNRRKLAKQHGIKGYVGTASQNIKLLNALRGNKTTAKSVKNYTPRTFKVGQTVALKKSASRFATGERIADFAKGKKYKIIQVKSDRVLLGGIMSWVNKSDVE